MRVCGEVEHFGVALVGLISCFVDKLGQQEACRLCLETTLLMNVNAYYIEKYDWKLIVSFMAKEAKRPLAKITTHTKQGSSALAFCASDT